MTMQRPGVQGRAGEWPPNVIELIQRQLSQFGRVGATKLYVAPALAAPVPAGPNGLGGPSIIRFREPGTVIACYGQAQTGTAAAFATLEVQILIGGSESIITDGQADTFAPMLALFGPNQNWFPLWRRAETGVDWTINFRNQAGGTEVPTFILAFIADADLARGMPR